MSDAPDAKVALPLPGESVQETSEVDARFGGLSIVGSSNDENAHRYRMDREQRGHFIIINNKNFLPETGMNDRSGTDEDAANLYNDFKKLGFTVHSYRNQTANQMLRLMIDAAKLPHDNCDCFGVAVLSHGDDSVLFGIDGTVLVDNFIAPIKGCPSLAGKPKIFIFQACRGNELDSGVEVHDALSSNTQAARIPLEADFLYAYSTVPGYFSWRNSAKGSWFIQALHKMLDKYGSSIDFLKLLTRVNHCVAYEFESNASQAHMNRKKQIPSVVSMLTKDLYFTSK